MKLKRRSMKLKLLLCTLALSVGLSATPQRYNPSPSRSSRPMPSRPERPQRPDHNTGRDQRNRDHNDVRDRQHRDRRFENGRRNAGRHWDGNRFDHRFFVRNFGIYHPFFFGGPGFYWYSNDCLYGSMFEYGDVYFGLEYPCTDMWLGYPWDGVYIDEGLEGYVLVNPAFPGQVFGIRVIF